MKLDHLLNKLEHLAAKEVSKFLVINGLLIWFQLTYIYLRFSYLNSEIPFYYGRSWGGDQLAPKITIFQIPVISLALLVIATVLFKLTQKKFQLLLSELVLFFTTLSITVLSVSLYRIIYISSKAYAYAIDPVLLDLVWPFFLAFSLAWLVCPKFIQLFKNYNLVTNPLLHSHPGMLLKKPSTRGGGLVFTFVFSLVTLVFVPLSKLVLGILICAALFSLLGLIDDYQNTNLRTRLKVIENPVFRLILITAIVATAVAFGIKSQYIGNPFDGIFNLDQFYITIAGNKLYYVSTLFTIVWVVWLLNSLSWSNGVDGQYGGIIGIALLVVAYLALRYRPVDPTFLAIAKLCAIAAGSVFGLTKYLWYPSKMMWGFGAMSAGMVLAAASIIVGGKTAISIIALFVPFVDAVVVFSRRIIQRKNPMKADTGHLHHLLRRRGWGVRRIALFYWATTALFGILGIISADQHNYLFVLTLGGCFAFAIICLNVVVILNQKKQI